MTSLRNLSVETGYFSWELQCEERRIESEETVRSGIDTRKRGEQQLRNNEQRGRSDVEWLEQEARTANKVGSGSPPADAPGKVWLSKLTQLR